MLHAEFRDPLLVAVYDAECPWTREDDFFLGVVGETPRGRVLDLGCGTGRLTLGLAAAGHVVTGVDPARASLRAARAKPGSERVTWVEGTSADLPEAAFDVAVMTSHVAQFFVTDEEFGRALADLRRALVPGGRLVFDTRDPAARRWEAWNPVDSHRQVELADGTVVTAWTEVTAVTDGAVSFTHHYALPDHQQLQSTATLRFRTEREVRAALRTAGFQVGHVYGGWNREPVGDGDGELLVIAHR
ncbi:class I SAM-dependent methyltransferase [Streptomyces sp. R302]|uniref:class I SAM-dependent methyltransferase n=1 Tax=unclassified Streptomyces TaxID=2593676 RepID=UPI00145D4275|nr:MULTISPECIES: class I SAM-dependent methyltransferase [unclassified Streptomyces]NML53168.1 class I SAM-dependent methyltransferase [Streptomyces sp. R301]NML82851.1 class I SAM-dependent methyltransferase [Streptomyces sp. R302]